jgi:hypothetical protein
MATGPISQDELALGRVILLATDSIGMDCEGACWLYDQEDGWRFYLITSLLASLGPREIYLLLEESLAKKVSRAECSNIAIYIATPNDYLVKKIGKLIQTDAYSTVPRKISFDHDGSAADAIVYRLSAKMSESATRSAGRRFKKMSRQLVGL